MSTTDLGDKDKYVNLSNIASLVSFSLLIGVVFALLRYHFYFQVLLHIPIFSFIDASELVLMTASTAITWVFYLGSISLAAFIRKSNEFALFQKWVLSTNNFVIWHNIFCS